MRRGVPVVVVLAMAIALAPGCSDEDSASDTTTAATTSVSPVAPGEAPILRVDQIHAAIAAVEAERGGPQEYFEINATPALVNVFVADVEAGQVIPYTYVDGELSAAEPSDAEGNTFDAAAIDFDPSSVTQRVTEELAGSTQDAFVIEGGPDGAIRRTVVVTSEAGGQLLVVVGPDGAVISVDAVE